MPAPTTSSQKERETQTPTLLCVSRWRWGKDAESPLALKISSVFSISVGTFINNEEKRTKEEKLKSWPSQWAQAHTVTKPCEEVPTVISLLNPTPDRQRNEFSSPSSICSAHPSLPKAAVQIRPQSPLCSHYLCQWSLPAGSSRAHGEPADVPCWTRSIVFI